ncbi:hypothetical protein MN202_09595 [Rheinheimera muenzenbergensis]|uniref:GIY-YIG domain-containing protein n=1 Tax=Rheinheimera muenzenbergensis TaxID=1193628 RepID=A0ABU8C6D4_9GAMM
MDNMVRTFLGFDFFKAGQFFISEQPYKNWQQPTVLQLENLTHLQAENGCYLICLGDGYCEENILYVGYYSGTLQRRSLRLNETSGEYVSWHSDNIDDNINKLLKIIHGIPCDDKAWKGAVARRKQFDEQIRSLVHQVQQSGQQAEISLWLIADANITLKKNGMCLNISAAVERYFLDSALKLPLNTVGNKQRKE